MARRDVSEAVRVAADLSRWRPIERDGLLVGVGFHTVDLEILGLALDGRGVSVAHVGADGRPTGRFEPDPTAPIDAVVRDLMVGSTTRGGPHAENRFPMNVAILDALCRDGDAVADMAHRNAVHATDPSSVEGHNDGPAHVRVDPEVEAASLRSLQASVAMARNFLGGLDPVALAIVGADAEGPLSSHVEGAWEGLDRGFGRGAPLARAIRRHPYLSRALTHLWRDDPEGLARGLSDDPRALAALAATRPSGVTARMLGSVRAMGEAFLRLPPESREQWRRHAGDVLDPTLWAVTRIAHVEESWLPRDAGQAHAAWEALPAVDWAHARSATPADEVRMVDVKGDWVLAAARLRATVGDVPLEDALRGLADMAEALVDHVVRPAMHLCGHEPYQGHGAFFAYEPFEAPASSILQSGRSVRGMLGASAAWHRALHGIQAVMEAHGGARSDTAWGAGLPGHREGDVECVVLLDGAALVAEGGRGPDADGVMGLDHCVGGYGRQCRDGSTRVMSVRRVTPDGRMERLSTVAFETGPDGPALTQHLGGGNGEPPPAATSFVEGYLRLLAGGRLAFDRSQVVPVGPEETDETEDAGYDFRRPGAWEAVRDAWAPFVPRPLRTMAPEDVVRCVLAHKGRHPDVHWLQDAFGTGSWLDFPEADHPVPSP